MKPYNSLITLQEQIEILNRNAFEFMVIRKPSEQESFRRLNEIPMIHIEKYLRIQKLKQLNK
jgi:hypothetical protein